MLYNTGRMTEAVLFSAKQAVHESERSLPAFSFAFFFSLSSNREISLRATMLSTSMMHHDVISNSSRIKWIEFLNNLLRTHLRNYYHEDEGHRGVDVARIARAFLIQGARSY